MKITTLVLFLVSFTTFSQQSTRAFFSNFTPVENIDTISSAQLAKIVKKYKTAFNQPMFTYGSDDPKEWELVSDYILKFPEICLPSANTIDINQDGIQDLVISMLGGSEYTKIGIYLGKKKGYSNSLFEAALFNGIDKNGDVFLLNPACCEDPTNDYQRVNIAKDGTVTMLDSLSIAVALSLTNPSHENLFADVTWETTTGVMTARKLDEPYVIYGAYEPGAEIRVIEKRTVNDLELKFCEIKGNLTDPNTLSQVYPHAFVWLSAE